MRDDPQVLCSRQLAVGCVGWPDGRRTVFVKLTLEPTSEGALVLSAEQRGAALDVTGAHGEVLVPGDFAPYKPACDVVVIERSGSARAEPGTVSVGAARFDVGPRESLGPRATFCPGGDPNDPESEALWSQPNADFNRFQSAEPQRRIAYPQPPLDLVLQRGTTIARWRFTGPIPRGYQLTRDASAVEFVMPLALDTVLIDPAEARVVLVFRAVIGARADGVIAIDASWERSVDVSRFRSFTPVKPAWPRTVARSGAPADVAGPSHNDETRALSGPLPLSAVLPFAPRPSRPSFSNEDAEDATMAAPLSSAIEVTRASEGEVNETSPLVRTHASTLPFRRTAGARDSASRRKLSAEELAELREREAAPSSPWGQDETHALTRPQQAPVPAVHDPTPAQRPERVPSMVGRLGYAPSDTGPSALTEAHSAARSEPTNAVAPAPTPETPEQIVAEVQREIWKATEPLAAILARRGLTESAWRDLKKQAKGR